jgi:transposase-like protein
MNSRPFRGFTSAEKEEMRQRRAQGETYAEIARAIGHPHPQNVWQWFHSKNELRRQSPTYVTERAEKRLAVAIKRLENAVPARRRKTAENRPAKAGKVVGDPRDALTNEV